MIILIAGISYGIGNYFVNYAIARSGNGGDRQVKDEVTISQELEDVIQKIEKRQQKKLKSGAIVLNKRMLR